MIYELKPVSPSVLCDPDLVMMTTQRPTYMLAGRASLFYGGKEDELRHQRYYAMSLATHKNELPATTKKIAQKKENCPHVVLGILPNVNNESSISRLCPCLVRQCFLCRCPGRDGVNVP